MPTALFDQLPVAYGCFDSNCHLIAANKQWLALFGIENNTDFESALPACQPCSESSRNYLYSYIKQAQKEGRCQFELQIFKSNIFKSNEEVFYLDIVLECNGPDFVTACAHDVSHYKTASCTAPEIICKTERNLNTTEECDERAMLMLDSAPLSCYLIMPFISEGKIVNFEAMDCNNAALNLFGFSSKSEATVHFFDIFSTSSNDESNTIFDEAFKQIMTALDKGFHRFEFPHRHKNGDIIPCEVTLVRVNHRGETILACYQNDLRLIKAAMAEVQRSYEMSQMFIDSAPFFVEIWDENLKLIECNQTAARVFGLTDADEYMRVFDDLSPEFQPDGTASAEKILSIVKTAFEEGRVHTEWVHLSPNGEQLPYDVTYVRLKRGDADIVVGYNIDLRDTRLREIAEDANKAKTSFLSTMSHEIRTPMNAILGVTEIQLMNTNLDPEIRDAFDKIYVSGDLLLSIINDILDLSKIESGKLELIINKYEIASFISDTAQLNMMRIGSKQIEFDLFVDENMPTHMRGDEIRVKQILNNLLSNAFKYTKEGKVTLTVSHQMNDKDNDITLILIVTDTGEGMSSEQVGKLFDEYSRFNEGANRTTEGTGLGMSITKNLIQMMNGEIFVESEPGKGSVFTVHLPQGNAGAEALGKSAAENLRQFRTSSRAQMKRTQITREPMPYGSVLIVDDVETNIYVAKGLLVPYELKIDSASSGFAAINKVKSGNIYDIIFMDHMMPGMDGIEATKHIRDMGYDKPIVALTANAITGQAEIFLESGLDDFISKPIDVRHLNLVLNKLVRDKQPQEVVEAARRQKNSVEADQANTQAQSIDATIAKVFIRDAKKSLETLESIFEKGGIAINDDLRTYIIHVHGMRSALANVKNPELSAVATRLEELGRAEKLKEIKAETPAFLTALRTFIEKLTADIITTDETAEAAEDDTAYLREKLLAIKAACEDYDEVIPEEVLAEFKDRTWSAATKEFIEIITRHLLLSEFDEIVDAVDKFLEGIEENNAGQPPCN